MANNKQIELAKDEYFAVVSSAPGTYHGWTYSTHRALGAARWQAKKTPDGRIYVCSNGTQRYEVK